MTQLFGRSVDVVVGNYRLTGLDCVFSIEKTLRGEPNKCSLKLYNLAEQTRASFEQLAPRRRYQTKGVPVRIEAGYGIDRALLWLGELRNVFTEVDGPEWVTSMDSGDGYLAFQNTRVNLSYGPMTPVTTVYQALVAKLAAAGISTGNATAKDLEILGMGKFYPHGTVIAGSAAQELSDLCLSAGLEWSIQDGVLQVLDRGQALRGKALLVSSEPNTGLVGSPSIDVDGIATVKILMTPEVRVGCILTLDTARIKGNFRLEKATWSGDTSSDDWYITMQARKYPSPWDLTVTNPNGT